MMEQTTDTAITTADEFRALAKYAGVLEKTLDTTNSPYVLSQIHAQVTSLVNHSLNVIISMDIWSDVNNQLGNWIDATNRANDDNPQTVQPAIDMLIFLHWALLTEATRA